MGEIYKKIKIIDDEKEASIGKKQAEFIYRFLQNKKINTSLEVGLAFGLSAAYIMSATKSVHYAIDPYQKGYDDLGLKNLKRLGFGKSLRFERDFSHNVLPRLLKKGLIIDFAFIDGDHRFDSQFLDFYYVDMMLKQKGYVLLHDSWMWSTRKLIAWIKNNKKNYRQIKTPLKILTMFQKIGEDKRDGRSFGDF